MSIENDTWLTANAARLGVNPAHVGPHSVDVCLGRHIIEKKPGSRDIRYTLGDGEAFTFEPGAFYLGETLETVHVPDTHRAQLLLKSSTARQGLNHLMAGYVDCGWTGVLTLEFVAHLPVTFRQGQRIAQLEYARLIAPPQRPYGVTGRYQGAQGVEEAKPEQMPFPSHPYPSPIESRALSHVRDLLHSYHLMRGQHARGRREYGHPIDDWAAFPAEALQEAAREIADAFTYLEYAEVTDPVIYAHLRAVIVWLESRVPAVRI